MTLEIVVRFQARFSKPKFPIRLRVGFSASFTVGWEEQGLEWRVTWGADGSRPLTLCPAPRHCIAAEGFSAHLGARSRLQSLSAGEEVARGPLPGEVDTRTSPRALAPGFPLAIIHSPFPGHNS